MIPQMSHPLGKYWDQPKDIREAPIDDKSVLLTQRQFDELPEYSRSVPSGVYPGKCWKRLHPNEPKPLLGWYGVIDANECSIEFREILIVAPAVPDASERTEG